MRDELKEQSADSKNVGVRYWTVILTDRGLFIKIRSISSRAVTWRAVRVIVAGL